VINIMFCCNLERKIRRSRRLASREMKLVRMELLQSPKCLRSVQFFNVLDFAGFYIFG